MIKKWAKTDAEIAFIEEMRDWFYSFMNDIENVQEEQDSLSKLKNVINKERGNDAIANVILDETLTFITVSFEDQLYRMSHYHYKKSWWGWVSENCFTESSNSSLSRDPFGPKPNHKLHVAGSCILDHTESTHVKIQTQAVKAIGSHKMKVENETVDQKVSRNLSLSIVDEKNELAMDQYLLSKSYLCMEVGKDLGKSCTYM